MPKTETARPPRTDFITGEGVKFSANPTEKKDYKGGDGTEKELANNFQSRILNNLIVWYRIRI